MFIFFYQIFFLEQTIYKIFKILIIILKKSIYIQKLYSIYVKKAPLDENGDSGIVCEAAGGRRKTIILLENNVKSYYTWENLFLLKWRTIRLSHCFSFTKILNPFDWKALERLTLTKISNMVKIHKRRLSLKLSLIHGTIYKKNKK